MVTDDPEDSPEAATLKALRDFVASDGWKVFQNLMDRDWGAERTIQRTEDALKALTGNVDQETINDTVQQIHAARKAVLAMLKAPSDEIRRLTVEPASRRPFDAFRRIGR